MGFHGVVQKLIDRNKTISAMESCTGGEVASRITDVEGASEVLKFSAVTYSNEFKIKMGVSCDTIDKYSVYSMEVAEEMSKSIAKFTGSNYGVGVTGKLNREDKNNLFGEDNQVFISIYDRDNNRFYNYSMDVLIAKREENKEKIVDFIVEKLLGILE